MALFSPFGFMRVLTTLVDRSLDAGDAAPDPNEPRSTPPKDARHRGRPRLDLVREDRHDTPHGETE